MTQVQNNPHLPAASKQQQQPNAANKSFTRLPSGLVIERTGGAWNWKQLFVADDGQSIVALSTHEEAADLWLWTASHAALAQHLPAKQVC